MKLTVENVKEIIMDCVYDNDVDEFPKEGIKVEGLTRTFGFDPEKIEKHKDEIYELLLQLPDTFRDTCGGGWSFLNMPTNKDDEQWGEQVDAEALLVLGIASNQMKILMPREMWDAFPGGVPYVAVITKEENG